MTAKQSEQSRERELTGFYLHHAKLARNDNILPFEFSKIVKDMKGKTVRLICKCFSEL